MNRAAIVEEMTRAFDRLGLWIESRALDPWACLGSKAYAAVEAPSHATREVEDEAALTVIDEVSRAASTVEDEEKEASCAA